LRILASFNSAFSRGNDRYVLQFILKVHLWLPNSPESHIGSKVMHTRFAFLNLLAVRAWFMARRVDKNKSNPSALLLLLLLLGEKARACASAEALPHSFSLRAPQTQRKSQIGIRSYGNHMVCVFWFMVRIRSIACKTPRTNLFTTRSEKCRLFFFLPSALRVRNREIFWPPRWLIGSSQLRQLLSCLSDVSAVYNKNQLRFSWIYVEESVSRRLRDFILKCTTPCYMMIVHGLEQEYCAIYALHLIIFVKLSLKK
jgi:hypothetical protein